MNKQEWIEKARSSRIRSFVERYTPARRHLKVEDDTVEIEGLAFDTPHHEITAPDPERARQFIVKGMNKSLIEDVMDKFDSALQSGDISRIYSFLSGAWFGVPESTSCWGITGFSEAVDLMDDMPEEE